MTGFNPNRPINRLLSQTSNAISSTVVLDADKVQRSEISKLQNVLSSSHNAVTRLVTTRRMKAIAAPNRATNMAKPRF